jgi:hypothetical protein
LALCCLGRHWFASLILITEVSMLRRLIDWWRRFEAEYKEWINDKHK